MSFDLTRLSPTALQALEKAGWKQDRVLEPDSPFMDRSRQGSVPHRVIEFYDAFCDLRIKYVNIHCRDDYKTWTIHRYCYYGDGAEERQEAQELVGEPVFELGQHSDNGDFFMDASGAVYFIDIAHRLAYKYGTDAIEAFNTLCDGIPPTKLAVDDATWDRLQAG